LIKYDYLIKKPSKMRVETQVTINTNLSVDDNDDEDVKKLQLTLDYVESSDDLRDLINQIFEQHCVINQLYLVANQPKIQIYSIIRKIFRDIDKYIDEANTMKAPTVPSKHGTFIFGGYYSYSTAGLSKDDEKKLRLSLGKDRIKEYLMKNDDWWNAVIKILNICVFLDENADGHVFEKTPHYHTDLINNTLEILVKYVFENYPNNLGC
jgi:hypothetical protein